MKIMTVMGTRPEIIRLSRVIPLLDELCDHQVVFTGQNYAPSLSEIFFTDLNLRPPDHGLECRAPTLMGQVARILEGVEGLLLKERPDRLLILGDTNSALSALAAKRLAIPVFHMEAGNRCYDDRVPEEINRRLIDHASDILMPYTEGSRRNLLAEGIPGRRIMVTGNPIAEVLEHYDSPIAASKIMAELDLEPQGYFLVTLHRSENVDIPQRLHNFWQGLKQLAEKYALPVVASLHPRTKHRLSQSNIPFLFPGLLPLDPPPGFFDFVRLEKNALCVLSDSGTVQEECCLFGTPAVTLRDVTERPETLEAGSNMLSGADPDDMPRCVKAVLSTSRDWSPPPEYQALKVSRTIAKIILGYQSGL